MCFFCRAWIFDPPLIFDPLPYGHCQCVGNFSGWKHGNHQSFTTDKIILSLQKYAPLAYWSSTRTCEITRDGFGPSSWSIIFHAFLHFTWREPPKLLGPFRSLSDSDHCPIKHFSEIEQHNGYLYLPHENYRLPYHPGWRFYLSTTREPPRMPWPGPFQARLRSRDVSPGRCVKHGAQNMWLLCLICMANGPKFFMMCIKKNAGRFDDSQVWLETMDCTGSYV